MVWGAFGVRALVAGDTAGADVVSAVSRVGLRQRFAVGALAPEKDVLVGILVGILLRRLEAGAFLGDVPVGRLGVVGRDVVLAEHVVEELVRGVLAGHVRVRDVSTRRRRLFARGLTVHEMHHDHAEADETDGAETDDREGFPRAFGFGRHRRGALAGRIDVAEATMRRSFLLLLGRLCRLRRRGKSVEARPRLTRYRAAGRSRGSRRVVDDHPVLLVRGRRL